MASLYKKPILVTDPKNGKKTKGKSRKWWGRYRDDNGVDKRVPLAVDKASTDAEQALVKKVERRASGIVDQFLMNTVSGQFENISPILKVTSKPRRSARSK